MTHLLTNPGSSGNVAPGKAQRGPRSARFSVSQDCLLVSCNHREIIQFFLIPSSASAVILGSLWLATHNPQFNWVAGTITTWSVACHSCCLRSVQPPASLISTFHSLRSISQEFLWPTMTLGRSFPNSMPSPSLHNVPTTGPSTFIRGRLFQPVVCTTSPGLSAKPWRHTSVSRWSQVCSVCHPCPWGMKKKDGSLPPCIHYRGLNDITICNRYPLPLLDAAFTSLQQVHYLPSWISGTPTTWYPQW